MSLGHRRLRLVLALSALAFAVVILRAFQLQVFDSSALAARAVAQQSSLATVPGLRGTIFDRNHYPLAQDQPAVTVLADQPVVKDKRNTAIAIALALGYSHPGLIKPPKHLPQKKKQRKATLAYLKTKNAKLTRRRRAYIAKVDALTRELTGTNQYATLADARQISPHQGKMVMAQHLPGITLISQGRRWYPGVSTAEQLLGYTDTDGNGQFGAGLEHLLNPQLASRPGEEAVVSSPGSGSALETIMVKPPHNGRNVTLTIDSNIQDYVQQVLGATVRRYGAHSATGIVMDPHTGAILAMASAPGYDNNAVHDLAVSQFNRLTPNTAVQDMYEPGSVMKVVTFSAALSMHKITPDSIFRNLPNQLHYPPNWTITDAEARGPKTFTASQILAESSNIGTDTIAKMVGPAALEKWIYRYGLGRRTALDLPGEATGQVLPLKDFSGSTMGTIPIGQGISVTAMQMADIYAAIANGGVMPQPHVIQKIAGEPTARLKTRRILSTGVDSELVDMLAGVVNEPMGTGKLAQIPGYSVAGKTGTAEKPNPNGPGYLTGKYVSSFVGFFPAHDPQVEIMVVVDSPRNGIFGGTVAAPAFADIGSWYAHTYNIAPDRPRQLSGSSSSIH